jgi:16S rRNA (cytidine1402-2'-O)-methyltransferase
MKEIAGMSRTAVFYESPHRLEKALAELAAVLPAKRKVTVMRELTKLFESAVAGSVEEVAEYYKAHPKEVRGEIVIIVSIVS